MSGLLITFLPVVTFGAVVWAIGSALARRGPHRFDVVIFLLLFGIGGFLPERVPGVVSLQVAVLTLLPWAVLRLVHHYRVIPRQLVWFAAAMPFGFAAYQVFGAGQFFAVTPRLAPAYAALGLLPLGVTFGLDAAAASGVKAIRLRFAALGTLCFVVTIGGLPIAALQNSRELGQWLAAPAQYLEMLGLFCYILAFAPPRRLITRWRRAEQANYLGQVNEREPEERGWLAADDLMNGASRCVGGAVAFVARRRAHSDDLLISASTDDFLLGKVFTPSVGLAAESAARGMAMLGRPAECEQDLARLVQGYGSLVLIAPIVGQGTSWGVVVAVHRRGALFPEDDLSMLAQLARNAAITLDHAALIRERREEARQIADRRFRELESRVGVMLDSIKDYAMLVLDAEGTVAAWHMGAEHVFGYTRQQITRQSGATLFGLTQEAFQAWLRDARQQGHAAREGVCRRFDGVTFIGDTSIRPLVAEPGVPPGFVVVTHDVTEQRGLEERLRQGQKMQAIGQLAGGVAHDFNNLLTAILGYADWLEADLTGDDRLNQIHEIQRAAERAADLTRQLLAFSRREMIQPASIDLSRLIQDLLPMLRRLIHEPIEIVDATSPLGSPVLGDRSQVEQIVLNLVLNARDAMPRGGRITIRTAELKLDGDSKEAGSHKSHVLLEVADTGVGMDAETRRRAFEPFFTTKDVGQGTGLGLATVYGIVQQMNGLIEVDSEVNRGTAFRLYLPHGVEAAPAPAPIEPARLITTGRENVLLVEDDDALRTYLAHVLECHGYRVMAAESPEAALALTDSLAEPLELVISDVVMPGMSGPELVAELVSARPGLAALYISGHAETQIAQFDGEHPALPLLQKPFSSTDLLTKVRQVLTAP